MKIGLLVKHFDYQKAVPDLVRRASFFLTNPMAVETGALEFPLLPDKVACHLGGLRWVNSWEGRDLWDGDLIARVNGGTPVYHSGYGADYRLGDFRYGTGQASNPLVRAKATAWRKRLDDPRYKAVTHVFNDVFPDWEPGVGIGWEVDLFRMAPEAPDWCRPAQGPTEFDRWAFSALNEAKQIVGVPIVSNCDGYPTYSRFGGGACIEGAFHWTGASDGARIRPLDWERQKKRLTVPQGTGEILLLTETKGDADWRSVLRFSLASVLVCSAPSNRIHYSFVARREFNGQSTWHNEFDVANALGNPEGPAMPISTPSTGLATAYRRQFEHGCVVVNPSGVDMVSPKFAAAGKIWGDMAGAIQRLKAGTGAVVLT